MAAIDDLLSQIENEELRRRIESEVKKLSKQKKFGLVFEDHLPEYTVLFDAPIKVGAYIKENKPKKDKIYRVLNIEGENVTCSNDKEEQAVFNKADLVSITRFGDPIYPYLEEIDSIENSSENDLWHILIEADNYHALQLLEYLYYEKVDCIYIDPPYNTGDTQWKYNNNYVDRKDSFRHSKWLSFIKRRLEIAKKLLKPDDSMLIVTIDEKEYIHLGALLEEMFPSAKIQMISTVINPKGSARDFGFSRAEEYIYFVYLGDAKITPTNEDMLRIKNEKPKKVRWAFMQRSGTDSRRFESPTLFYPIFFNRSDDSFHSTGASLPFEMDRNNVKAPEGTYAVFPIGRNNVERRWQLSQATFEERLEKGYVKFGPHNEKKGTRSIYYISNGILEKMKTGEIKVIGQNEDGSVILENNNTVRPMSVWSKNSHSASEYGSSLLTEFLPDRKFPFPKSLYAVTDTLRFFVADKPDALILDFFAGSGTTLHGVSLLNAEDEGNRQCILVTNNEVSDKEAKKLTSQGYKPSDEEWEELGIARYITWPRTISSITGKNTLGNPIEGEYLDTDVSISEGFESNAIYLKLGFLDKNSIALGRQFTELLPVLWMKAGAIGKCPQVSSEVNKRYLMFPDNQMAVLLDERYFNEFETEIVNKPHIKTIFIVTDSLDGYREMIQRFTEKETYQLYRDYLDNFRINIRRG